MPMDLRRCACGSGLYQARCCDLDPASLARPESGRPLLPLLETAQTALNRGEIAEAEQHHPDISLGWGKVQVTTYTHSSGGLSENDFILAAKVDELCGQPAGSAER